VLARLSELLPEAREGGAAVGAFTCYNLETAAGVLQAAEARRCGVVLLVSPQSFSAPGGRLLLAALVAAAARSETRACVELDHVREAGPIEAAFELGAVAVLADGSRLPLAENADFVHATSTPNFASVTSTRRSGTWRERRRARACSSSTWPSRKRWLR
jgi:fructose/tagatose bisphosphate aldolase